MLRTTLRFFCALLLLGICHVLLAQGQETLTFQEGVNGYTGTRDTRILSLNPATNYGNDNELRLDDNESSLILWDLTEIPFGSAINAVDITVNITNSSSNTYEFYEMKRPWVENEATWSIYAVGQSWEIFGAEGVEDRGSTVLGTFTASSRGTYTTSLNAAGVAMVQSWIDNPSSNHGFIITDYNNSNGADFSSSEANTVTDRPMLTVYYSSQSILTVSSPNGGESWEGGSIQNITWNSVGSSGSVKIEYSIDNGVNWSDIVVSTPDNGSYPWIIPNTPTTQALLRISDTDGNGPIDTSDAAFTIRPTPFITVTSPNGTESWEGGSVQFMTWNSIGTSGNINIEYSVDNGISWSDIITSTADDGTEPWTIPDTSTLTALVRISDSDGNGPVDTSDAVFTITPKPILTLLTPNGSEIWEVDSTRHITWSSENTTGNVRIEYSVNSGLSWNDIVVSTPDTGSYPWVVPATASNQALVRISDVDGDGPEDTSDAPFFITSTPLLIVTSPNGGESWEGGTSQNISWNSVRTSGTVKLEYSVDNGLNWSDIVVSIPDTGSYPWIIPGLSSTQALVRISDTDGNGPGDTSDMVFTITPIPSVTLITPNGGENWEGGSVQNITWSSIGNINNVKLEYSSNGGTNWNLITAATANDGIEPWAVPNTPTNTALVRISNIDGNGPVDTSDAVFTITPKPTLTILTPNGGESWGGGKYHNITWTSVVTSGTVKIEYSANSGLSWNELVSSTPDNGSLDLILPDISTTTAAIRISDTDGDGPADTSDAVFTITPMPGETIIFSATGDVPYGSDEIPTFQQQIADHNLYSPSELFVHVGDIKAASDPCDESIYSDMADYLLELAVPAYIVPGDNETVDCSDEAQGWAYWYQYFLDFELNFCGAPFTEKQAVRPENIAFVSKGVLFIGINLVNGASDASMVDDADWVEQQLQQKVSQVRATVVFAQEGPGSSSRDLFFDRFVPAAQNFGKSVLFLHGSGHSWIMDYPFAASNILRIQVDNGGSEEPVQIIVTKDPQNIFAILRNPFSNNPQIYNVMPCVDAGADLQITPVSIANLQGKVKDDGVPTLPDTLTTTWSKISGAGAVTFGSPNAAITTASFSLLGNYVLRLTANDGQLQNYDEIVVEVTDFVLPVVLSAFSAIGGDNKVILKWTTSSEISNVGFEVYRSEEKDGEYMLLSSYETDTRLKGAINSSNTIDYSFTDEHLINDRTYWYKLADIDLNGVATFHGPVSALTSSRAEQIIKLTTVPTKFELHQNYPNPFNPETTIKISLPLESIADQEVNLRIYNSLGKQVKTLISGKIVPGVYEIVWDGTNDHNQKLASGTYFIRLQSAFLNQTRKMLLVR